MTVAELGGLVGPYYFPKAEWVTCQLMRPDGRLCEREHGEGWVARRKDGVEVLIGIDCANRWFEASREYASEASRVRREIRVDELVDSINARLNDAAFRERAGALAEIQRQLLEQVLAARESWPQTLLQRLRNMVKTGNRRVVVEFRYVEKDEKGGEHTTWQPVTLSSISGAEGLDAPAVRQLGDRLDQVARVLVEAAPGREAAESIMRGWRQSLDDLTRCETELEQVTAALADFHDHANLRPLCWLVHKDSDQRAIVRAILEREGTVRPSEVLIQTTLNAWKAEVRATNQGRDFRMTG
jgi:hypothetical protein